MRGWQQRRSSTKHVLRRRDRSFISNVRFKLKRGVWRERERLKVVREKEKEKEKADKAAERQRQKEERLCQGYTIIPKEEEASLKASFTKGQMPETCR
jgi:hypothetical protein